MRAWEARPPPSHPLTPSPGACACSVAPPAPPAAAARPPTAASASRLRRVATQPRRGGGSARPASCSTGVGAPSRPRARTAGPPSTRCEARRRAAPGRASPAYTCGSAVAEALHAAAADAARRGPTQRPVRTFSSTACPAWYARAVSKIESLSAMALKSKAALESGTAWPRRRRMPPTESTSAHSHRRAVESPTNVSERPRRSARALSLPTSPKPQQRASLAHCHWPECHSPAPERSRQALGSHEVDMNLECERDGPLRAKSAETWPVNSPARRETHNSHSIPPKSQPQGLGALLGGDSQARGAVCIPSRGEAECAAKRVSAGTPWVPSSREAAVPRGPRA